MGRNGNVCINFGECGIRDFENICCTSGRVMEWTVHLRKKDKKNDERGLIFGT
jgi:hypothetical protein